MLNDLLNGKSNKLAQIALLDQTTEGDLFWIDALRLTANLFLSLVLLYLHQPEIALVGSLGLMIIDILPRTYIKMTFYKAISRNQDSSKISFLGHFIRILAFSIVPFMMIICFLYSQNITIRIPIYIGMFLLYMMGLTDKVIIILTHRFILTHSEHE